MPRKKSHSVPEAPEELTVTVLIGGNPVSVKLADIIHDPQVFLERHVSDAYAMQLHFFKQGISRGEAPTKVPMVFGPRPDGKYAVTGFRSN